MVDHTILISRLENLVGIQGTVLNWFQSFLTNRKFSVSFSAAHLSCGVPQGSILAPILFSLYLLPFGLHFCKNMEYLFTYTLMTPNCTCPSNIMIQDP